MFADNFAQLNVDTTPEVRGAVPVLGAKKPPTKEAHPPTN
jgi:hypothetical protein